ncbi:MAG: RyR domain-containing protein [Rikenellaceae bacterium]
MINKTYTPIPLNTEEIELPPDLTLLTEDMAHNVHEVWALGRIKDGWSYGKTRNDSLKTHPCLIPYEELPESERDFDRQTATQTLKLIMKLGFEISKK